MLFLLEPASWPLPHLANSVFQRFPPSISQGKSFPLFKKSSTCRHQFRLQVLFTVCSHERPPKCPEEGSTQRYFVCGEQKLNDSKCSLLVIGPPGLQMARGGAQVPSEGSCHVWAETPAHCRQPTAGSTAEHMQFPNNQPWGQHASASTWKRSHSPRQRTLPAGTIGSFVRVQKVVLT